MSDPFGRPEVVVSDKTEHVVDDNASSPYMNIPIRASPYTPNTRSVWPPQGQSDRAPLDTPSTLAPSQGSALDPRSGTSRALGAPRAPRA
jgi:hypothetical protein